MCSHYEEGGHSQSHPPGTQPATARILHNGPAPFGVVQPGRRNRQDAPPVNRWDRLLDASTCANEFGPIDRYYFRPRGSIGFQPNSTRRMHAHRLCFPQSHLRDVRSFIADCPSPFRPLTND